jgi:hypothetical protein
MTARELVALCESRINGLSRTRQAFEHSSTPEHVDGLIDDLRTQAAGWDRAVGRPPAGDPVALRVGARAVRGGVPGFGAVADALETYASALESGQARHAAGISGLHAAQRRAAALAGVDGDGSDGDDGSCRAAAASRAAVAVLDVACAGFAACQDAFEAERDAERALYATLSYVRVRRSGRPGELPG